MFQPSYSPVLSIGWEQVGFEEGEGGYSVAKYVGTPHQGDPVVEDDSGREPVEVVGVGQPKSVSNHPTLQSIDLVLVHQACRQNYRRGEFGK